MYILIRSYPGAEGDPVHHVIKNNKSHDGQDRLRRQDESEVKELTGFAVYRRKL